MPARRIRCGLGRIARVIAPGRHEPSLSTTITGTVLWVVGCARPEEHSTVLAADRTGLRRAWRRLQAASTTAMRYDHVVASGQIVRWVADTGTSFAAGYRVGGGRMTGGILQSETATDVYGTAHAVTPPRLLEIVPPESFRLSADQTAVERIVLRRDGTRHSTSFPLHTVPRARLGEARLAELASREFLRLRKRPPSSCEGAPVRVVDLFSGCGAMTLGAWEACRAIGRPMEPVLAIDFDATALAVYSENFPTARVECLDVTKWLNSPLGSRASAAEQTMRKSLGPASIDLLLGGPPCQGHSDLNNRTRRSDPKNSLYDRMARFAEIARPAHIIVENVPAVRHDHGRVLETTILALRRLGYGIDHGIVDLSAIGGAQSRRRHVLVGSLESQPNVQSIVEKYARRPQTVQWAIGDLRKRSGGPFDSPANPTRQNQKRIDWLFDKDEYDLPDRMRPDCHRFQEHSYRSVYGRMHWDAPAQTITSGFGCMGQGRFVHPKERRTLTPHEAARLQFIPDFFRFDARLKRTALAQMIGNAVPPRLIYVLALDLLR